MSLELSFNNQLKPLATLPSDLSSFKSEITSLYSSGLPKEYQLEFYSDDRNKVTLSDDKDYEKLLETAKGNQENPLKVKVVPTEKNGASENIEPEPNRSEGEQIILIENKEEFESQLPHASRNPSLGAKGKDNDILSSKSLPSSQRDHAEKQPIIDKVAEEVREKGIIDLKHDIIHDPEFDPLPLSERKLEMEKNINIINKEEGPLDADANQEVRDAVGELEHYNIHNPDLDPQPQKKLKTEKNVGVGSEIQMPQGDDNKDIREAVGLP